MSFAHSPKIVTDGLVLSLDAGNTKSYPGTGTTWFDKSGFSNNGTLINGPTFNTGSLGSIVFDGTNDYVGSFPNYSTYFDFGLTNSPFSISLFFKLAVINSDFKVLVVTGGKWDYGLWISNTNKLLCGTELQNRTGNTTLSANLIYQGTLTFNGTTQTLYLNGVNDGSFTQGLSNNGSQNLSIGRRVDGFYFPGNIYTTQIYNKSLSPSEVTQNFNALRGRFGI
jgi:hypothetical protein